MNPQKVISWFQIPATDIQRAAKFYTNVLGVSFHHIEDPQKGKHAFFMFDALEPLRTGGEIYQGPHEQPSQAGTLVYLTAPGAIEEAVAKVEPAGGKVIMPKMAIGEHGFIALILDTEGNRIGLHAQA